MRRIVADKNPRRCSRNGQGQFGSQLDIGQPAYTIGAEEGTHWLRAA
jgi:hypothetical protein